MEMNETIQGIESVQSEPHKERKVWSKAEKIILPVSLLLAILFDRLVVYQLFNPTRIIDGYRITRDFAGLRVLPGVFWLAWLAGFYAIYWKRICRDYVLWLVAACATALAVWNFIFPTGNTEFRIITFLVIPGVLIAHAQWAAFGFSMKSFREQAPGMAIAWLEGVFVKPFTGIGALFGVSASMVSKENRPIAKRVAIGLGIVFAMMLVIIPLLMGADQVFGHYVSRFFSRFSIGSLILHGHIIFIAFMLFFSLLWNVGFGKNYASAKRDLKSIDNVISGIILGGVILVYVLFCIVQFTYLFARAGLPEGLTFSEYARAGFAQTVAVCAINLLIFGVFLWRGKSGKLIPALLSVLLVLTGIKLVSGAVRLNLYIDAFGMTWLRLLSAWFLIYLAAVVVLCMVRLLFKKEMPVVGISVLLLLVWYVALGYLNPDGFSEWFNVRFT